MTNKRDRRTVARWCYQWLPRSDGEYYVGDQQYEERVCGSLQEAAAVATERDIHGEGRVVIEEYRHQAYGLYDWEEIESYDIYEIGEKANNGG
jgi:hypothetical protein